MIGQALVDAQWLECITDADQEFKDEYSLYRPGQVRVSMRFVFTCTCISKYLV